MVSFRQPTTDPKLQADAEAVHHAWNAALAAKDVDGAAALYTEDATIESPLVAYLLGTPCGILSGRDAIRSFLPKVFANQPANRRTFRNPVFTDGTMLMWEYPRATPDGDQMDFTEVMELAAGRIRRHRVYWGWVGAATLITGTHAR